MSSQSVSVPRLLLPIIVAMLLVFGVSAIQPEQAYASNPTKHSQAQIRAKAKSLNIDFESADTYSSKPSTKSGSYKAGKMSSKSQKNALKAVKLMRYIAGVNSDVKLKNSYVKSAQAAALIQAANNSSLSHYPSRPSGMSKSLYKTAYKGSSKCNLNKTNRVDNNAAHSVLSYMYDWGDSNKANAGHRRWILNPQLKYTGFGSAGSYNAMYAVDKSRKSSTTNIAWPAANMPTELMNDDELWTFQYKKSSLGKVKSITVTRKSDGKTWKLNSKQKQGYFHVSSEKIGSAESAVVFKPKGISSYKAGDTYTVKVKGSKKSYTYKVKFFDLYKTSITVKGSTDNGRVGSTISNNGTYNITMDSRIKRVYASLKLSGGSKRMAEYFSRNDGYDISWKSSDPSVASVSGTYKSTNYGFYGSLNVKKPGKTKITAKYGKQKITFTLVVGPADIAKAQIENLPAYTNYTGSARTINASLSYWRKGEMGSVFSYSTLCEGTDYTVSYANNVEKGYATVTYTGKGNYTGSVTKTFKIT